MDHPLTAIYDANVLYPAPLRDLLIKLAQAGLVRARWPELIHDEWTRNVLANNPHGHVRAAWANAFPDE
jgi:hypothetical protein